MNAKSGSILERPRQLSQDRDPGVASATPTGRLASIGAFAGAASVVVFTVVHQLTISNIWPMLGPMIVAGALCGSSIAWTYGRLLRRHSIGSWIGYNAAYLAMLGALAVASVLLFEPVTTMAAISAEGGPVDDLIVKSLPLTIGFTLVTTGILGAALARRRGDYLRLLLTVSVLVLFLGLNVSVLGLVGFSGGSILPVVAFFGLIVLLDVVFVAGVICLQAVSRRRRRGSLRSGNPPGMCSGLRRQNMRGHAVDEVAHTHTTQIGGGWVVLGCGAAGGDPERPMKSRR